MWLDRNPRVANDDRASLLSDGWEHEKWGSASSSHHGKTLLLLFRDECGQEHQPLAIESQLSGALDEDPALDSRN